MEDKLNLENIKFKLRLNVIWFFPFFVMVFYLIPHKCYGILPYSS